MRPKVITLTGDGAGTTSSAPVIMNWRQDTFQVGLGFVTDGSTTGFTVQHSFDDPYAEYANSYGEDAKWFDHDDMADMTADADGSLDVPVRALRLQANASGTDTGTLTIVQATR